jgi:membrane protein involved in colicin uptake
MKPDKTSDDKQTKHRMAALVTVMVVIWLILFVIFLAILLWGSNNAMQEVQWAR